MVAKCVKMLCIKRIVDGDQAHLNFRLIDRRGAFLRWNRKGDLKSGEEGEQKRFWLMPDGPDREWRLLLKAAAAGVCVCVCKSRFDDFPTAFQAPFLLANKLSQLQLNKVVPHNNNKAAIGLPLSHLTMA